jgi:hypothetical protein
MAVTDRRTEINDAENSAEWSTDGAQLNNTSLSGLVFQGTNAISVQHSNADEATYATQDSGGTNLNLNLGADVVYVLVKHNLTDGYSNNGAQVMLGDGTDRIGYAVGGNDAIGMPLSTYFSTYRLGTNQAQGTPGNHHVYAGTEANLSFTAVTQVGYGSMQTSKAQGNVANTFIDRITYAGNGERALEVTGGTSGTPFDTDDIVSADVSAGMGMTSNPNTGQYLHCSHNTTWGDDTTAGTDDLYFTVSDEVWTIYSDNGGGRQVSTGTWYWGQASASITEFKMTSCTILTSNQNVGGAINWIMTGAAIHDDPADVLEFTDCTFNDLQSIEFPTTAPGLGNSWFMLRCIFNACGQMDFGRADIDDCSFIGKTTNGQGAMRLDEIQSGLQQYTNLEFTSAGAGAFSDNHAVHITPTGAGPFTYNFDNWTFTGYASDAGTATDRAVYINPATSSANITINVLNGGTTPSIREAAGYTGTVTINNNVTVTTDGVAEGTAIKVIANETVGTITAGDVLDESFADSTGTASFTINYESAFDPSGLDVLIRARNQGLATAAIADDGGTQTDETAEANSPTTNDMTLTPATPVVNDAYYFGHQEQFARLKLWVTTAGADTTLTWEYYNGSGWSALTGVTDGTSNFETTGDNVVSWTIPGNWATTTVNAQGPYYYVRARVSAVGGAESGASGRQCLLDVTRYLPIPPSGLLERTITDSGLTATLSQAVDSISDPFA